MRSRLRRLRQAGESARVVEADVGTGVAATSATGTTTSTTSSSLTTATAAKVTSSTTSTATATARGDGGLVEGLLDLKELLLLPLTLLAGAGLLGSGVELVTARLRLDDLVAEALPRARLDGTRSNGLAADDGLLGSEVGEVLVEGLGVVDLLNWGSLGGEGSSLLTLDGSGRRVAVGGLGLSAGVCGSVLLVLELALAVVSSPALVNVLVRVAARETARG